MSSKYVACRLRNTKFTRSEPLGYQPWQTLKLSFSTSSSKSTGSSILKRVFGKTKCIHWKSCRKIYLAHFQTKSAPKWRTAFIHVWLFMGRHKRNRKLGTVVLVNNMYKYRVKQKKAIFLRKRARAFPCTVLVRNQHNISHDLAIVKRFAFR